MNKFKRTIFIVLALAILIPLGYQIIPKLTNAPASNKQETDWKRQVLTPKIIRGRIIRLEDYGVKNPVSYTVTIKNGEEYLSYGIPFCKENEEFRKYASIDDSISKEANSVKIKLIKKNGEIKEFDFPFCDD
jgi:hypothetical protein